MLRAPAVSLALCWALAATLGPGCASDGSAGGGDANVGGEGGASEVSCVDDPRVDTYTAKLERAGERGKALFELTSSEPAPPAKGSNVFVVTVRDSDGAALSGDLTIDLYMPDHGHGTSVTPRISGDDGGNVFTIEPVYLFMPGVWRVRLGLEADGSVIDQAELYFCIEG